MRRMSTGMVVVLLIATAVAAAAADGDALQRSIDENTAKLAKLRDSIRAKQARIDALDDREAEVRRGREEIQEEIELNRQLVGEMVQKEAMLAEQSRAIALQLADTEVDYDARKRALAHSLRRMYLRQQAGGLEMVVTAESFSDLMARLKLARMMAKLEAGLLEEAVAGGRRLQSERTALDTALAEIWQTRADQGQRTERLELLLAEQMASLRELDDERKELKNSLLELGLNEQKLTYIMEDLEHQRVERDVVAAPDAAASTLAAGGLEWPVQGELLRGFGRSVHPRFKTVTLNNGVNIAAAQGAPVAAAASGRVEFSDHLPGFGRCVILDHGAGYYTLYAHLDRGFVNAGDEVSQGQIVAEVGRPEGDDQPQLYFEVRHGRTPLDPTDWLRSR